MISDHWTIGWNLCQFLEFQDLFQVLEFQNLVKSIVQKGANMANWPVGCPWYPMEDYGS